jgi:NADH dehydrogenase
MQLAAGAPIVTIFGGSGFVGRYIARRMAKAGWRVRVAVRRPNEALFVRTYGFVGQVEPVLANVRNDASVAAACQGATAVVYSVGVLAPSGDQTFEAVQAEGAGRAARAARAAGADRFVLVSAIGADAASDSDYARTKARGEASVTAAFPDAVILRPSIIFGTEDQFFNRFGGLSRLSPVLPVIGPDTRFQPVWVDDVAAAAEVALSGCAAPGIYELGGPEVAGFRDLMVRMLGHVRRRRAIVALPFWLASVAGTAFDIIGKLSFGLIPMPWTADQVRLLRRDNVVAPGARGFDALGIQPAPMDAVIEKYLIPYRPQGQFTDLTASARNMRKAR